MSHKYTKLKLISNQDLAWENAVSLVYRYQDTWRNSFPKIRIKINAFHSYTVNRQKREIFALHRANAYFRENAYIGPFKEQCVFKRENLTGQKSVIWEACCLAEYCASFLHIIHKGKSPFDLCQLLSKNLLIPRIPLPAILLR